MSGLLPDEILQALRGRHLSGPRVDPDTGLVTGTIELPGGLPPEDPEDDEPQA